MLREALVEANLEPLVDVALLLATELCTNSVQHAGTVMELALSADVSGLTVAVTDRGAMPVEFSAAGAAALPERYGGGHGLRVVAALASEWGTRHDSAGRHVVWFSLAIDPELAPAPAPESVLAAPAGSRNAAATTAIAGSAASAGSAVGSGSAVAPASASSGEAPIPAATGTVETAAAPEADSQTPAHTDRAWDEWPSPQTCRWLLHMPGSVATRLDVPALVAELLRRLCEVVGADEAHVVVDYGDGQGDQLLAHHSGHPGHHRATAGPIDVQLAMDAPLRGRLRVLPRASSGPAQTRVHAELAELSAQRIALAVESDWLRSADRRRRSWSSYLAETSELLAQSLDVNFSAALVPQIIIPRLGGWCAVHLFNQRGKLVPASWSHADETALPVLRTWLDGERSSSDGALRPRINEALRSGRMVSFASPVDGVVVPLKARGTTLGTMSVGRPGDRAHTAEDVALISDIARRASLAIANAQLNAAHVTVSQAFQRALLPRALPVSEQVEFAAAYLPASAGTDVGGDFYDVLALPDERWLVAVGDVCGKGASAAARTGRVRDVLRVLVRDGYELERAVRLLNDALDDNEVEPQFCTLAGAVVSGGEDAGLKLDLVLAGHDQPMLVRPDASVRFVGDFGTAVGVLDDMKLHTTRHNLQRGDTMVIYTDGVTERRHGAEFFGRARLAEAASRMAGTSAASMANALRVAARDFSPDPPKDDIALLVVKAL
jgi:serine phosphatase RsbU (regulator of sigma subunit)/anti-sigma regulatory factor (Ser/Thr protein kinase)